MSESLYQFEAVIEPVPDKGGLLSGFRSTSARNSARIG